MNDDLKNSAEAPAIPAALYRETLQLCQMSLHPSKVLTKFYLLNLLGALLTLAICPQYGFGPFGGEVGFIYNLLHAGPVTCGLACAGIFFAGGSLLSFLFLNRAERKWVTGHDSAVLLPYISGVFLLGMALKGIAPGHIHHDVLAYYVSWVGGAVVFSFLFSKGAGVLGQMAAKAA